MSVMNSENTQLNFLFCLTNSSKPKDIQLTITVSLCV